MRSSESALLFSACVLRLLMTPLKKSCVTCALSSCAETEPVSYGLVRFLERVGELLRRLVYLPLLPLVHDPTSSSDLANVLIVTRLGAPKT